MRSPKLVLLLAVLLVGMTSVQAQLSEPATITNDPAFDAVAEYSASTGHDALLIYRDGVLVYETYHNFDAETPHALNSGTKSFSCAIAIRAEMDGLLTLDEPVADTITEWADDPVKSTITIRNLLSLTSGLPGIGSRLFAFRRTDAVDAAINDSKLIGTPGEVFAYGPNNYFVFSEVMRRKLNGETAWDYLTTNILDPLEISVSHGTDGADHVDLAAQGVTTTREWARYGQLILQNGMWNGQQLLDPVRLSECFRASAANTLYGLTFWLNFDLANLNDIKPTQPVPYAGDDGMITGATAPQVIIAGGAGDQRLIIVPSLNLVAVRFSRGDRAYSDAQLLQLLIDGAS